MHPTDIIDMPRPPRRRRPFRWVVLAIVLLFFLGGTLLSYYVEALWFDSLGYGQVFWKTLALQSTVFGAFAVLTFAILYGAFRGLEPDVGSDGFIMMNGRPVRLPVGPVLRFVAGVVAAAIALATAAGMASDWPTFALWWYGRPTASAFVSAADRSVDPIFGRPIPFYLFSLPAWQEIAGWLITLALVLIVMALFAAAMSGTAQAAARLTRRRSPAAAPRGLAFAWAFGMLTLALRVWLNRFDLLFADHTIFSGVGYTDAHVTIGGMTVIATLLAAGGLVAAAGAATARPYRWLVFATIPAVLAYAGVGVTAAYVNSFIVKPNELVKERPFIGHNIALTRQAYGLNRVVQQPFPAETSIEAADPARNQATLQNVRLWDWRVLQDTLRQLQEIRTYYDFPDIDIDRYTIDGAPRQVMLAARELNIEKLPVSSRNWINEKLIYTHGYGVTMNYVNGFTPEGLPMLLLRDMPVLSTLPGVNVTRPEIYFGETTNGDVYVKTRQQEFNYPQGQTNSLTSYEGNGGIVIGGAMRKLLIALERGDVAKLPFSDDVTPESRLLMRRNVSERIEALAPFLTFDADPYMVVRADGRLAWMVDAFTTSDRYPYSRAYRVEQERVNYVRNSVKVVIDAYDGSTTFYVFDASDPIIAAYRTVFPTLFRDAAEMPADLRAHVRYPELLLALQANVYGLYHMTDPEVFYNREDLWSVATDVATSQQSQSSSAEMEPNFLVMKLPGESKPEFIEMLPFSPANRNNLIGWIAGRSDGQHYGEGIVYDFPKTRLVDGPLQIEARIDQNPQLSGQLSLWNQQGSHVRRGSLLVIPIGRALLYVESIYLQAERSPMPELRLIVLAMQDRLVYAPTFDDALATLFGNGTSSGVSVPATAAATPAGAQSEPSSSAPTDQRALIARAAAALADYQRLTAEGKLAEAGQKLEELKRTLDELNRK
ncbi:MAG TPA: UPF0182 family protein [Vicinamibacterales bacterium]|jgi:uncharacterized membrane protein (UPF0182 family)|nr:UPF0182 family protein [Vicinamibacterales bacterium]